MVARRARTARPTMPAVSMPTTTAAAEVVDDVCSVVCAVVSMCTAIFAILAARAGVLDATDELTVLADAVAVAPFCPFVAEPAVEVAPDDLPSESSRP